MGCFPFHPTHPSHGLMCHLADRQHEIKLGIREGDTSEKEKAGVSIPYTGRAKAAA